MFPFFEGGYIVKFYSFIPLNGYDLFHQMSHRHSIGWSDNELWTKLVYIDAN